MVCCFAKLTYEWWTTELTKSSYRGYESQRASHSLTLIHISHISLWSSCRATTEHQPNWWFHLKNLTEFPPLLCLCIIIPNFDPSNYGAKRKKTQFHSIAMQFKMWSLRGSDFQRKCRKSVLKWWQLGQTFLWLSYSPFGMESSIFVSQLWFSSSICCVYVIQLYSTGIPTTGWAFRF